MCFQKQMFQHIWAFIENFENSQKIDLFANLFGNCAKKLSIGSFSGKIIQDVLSVQITYLNRILNWQEFFNHSQKIGKISLTSFRKAGKACP